MKNDNLLILLTNDDGIHAPGLFALYQEIKKLGKVLIVAPDSERSAVGHAITLSQPLRVWPWPPANRAAHPIPPKSTNFTDTDDGIWGYAVSGTPADCVKIAYWALLQEHKPDLLISGINHGSNTGLNVIYSGTVSAATEGTILNIPSFAISLTTYEEADFSFAAKFARKLATVILQNGLPVGTYLNVNVPAVPENQIRGIAITRQGQAVYREKFEQRKDPQNKTYYWLTGYKINLENDGPDTDDYAILNNMISITPVHYDLTNYQFLDKLKQWKLKLE